MTHDIELTRKERFFVCIKTSKSKAHRVTRVDTAMATH